MYINFLIQTYFLSTRSIQLSFLLTNQNASDTARTNEISRYKSKNVWQIRQRASERRVSDNDISFEPSKSLGEMPKVR